MGNFDDLNKTFENNEQKLSTTIKVAICIIAIVAGLIFFGWLISPSSDSAKTPNTRDGYVGDNDGDGDVDEKDWEREWKDYLNERMS
ncbi:MAG: hypothetical protein K6G82_00065 [Ruminococcus sp.]|nr:hypothetical protein [Ruminococcus sp.]